ncbi:glycosyltransferase [Bacillus sp. FJAT-49705]|uniref:Glycosyltransferase n=1 Tax=Cytobacillus citreus TaxID=2833586 RepID=A0ABS5NY00_9BACI|nr:glycosyltransferase [Cytobacillus citreus]MBS4192705.1 glycosyltransferase [Cytobacillus citreus]
MEVSIILPSYNRYPLNLLSLYALENQTFDLSEMEVILIDDASTDQTEVLKEYQAPFQFIYLKTTQNIGLAAARNLGVKMSNGKVIVFLDAEMIVDPNYILNRYRHHLDKENVVVIGGKRSGKLYTYLFPKYGKKQINDLAYLVKMKSAVKKRIAKSINKKVNSKKVRAIIKKLKHPIQLLNQEDINNFQQLDLFTVKKDDDLLAFLGGDLETSPLAWWACLGNLSMNRSFFDSLEGYEEAFRGWGPEDAEFAYRLYKAGAKFVSEPALIRYHQEHEKHKTLSEEDDRNWLLFMEKHPDLSVCIRDLSFIIMKMDYTFMDNILRESLTLKEEYDGKYEKFEHSLIMFLKEIRILKSQNKPISHLMQSSGIESDAMTKQLIFEERDEIESYGKYTNLVELFDLLTRI